MEKQQDKSRQENKKKCPNQEKKITPQTRKKRIKAHLSKINANKKNIPK
jgi:hypothetical protein